MAGGGLYDLSVRWVGELLWWALAGWSLAGRFWAVGFGLAWLGVLAARSVGVDGDWRFLLGWGYLVSDSVFGPFSG